MVRFFDALGHDIDALYLGYGNVVPVTAGGRLFLCFYAVLSLGLIAVVFNGIGQGFNFLMNDFIQNHMQWLRYIVQKQQACKQSAPWWKRSWYFVVRYVYVRLSVVCALSMGLSFWILGSVIFMHTESWTFIEAFYFCLVTLSTIGEYPMTNNHYY